MTPVSAVIITFNEAKNIGRCLAALQPVVDEIVVVDSYSTDETPEICKKYDVRFLQREWAGYAATKNWANAQATHAYVLSVDADEVVDDELAHDIMTQRKVGLTAAFAVNRMTNYCGHWVRYCGWYPDRKVRLFPKDRARWEGDFVHENLVLDPGLPTEILEGHLLHYSYHTLQDHRDRAERYAGLHARKMLAEGRRGSLTKALLSALWKFITVYFFKLGVLDGDAGWNIARYSAHAVFLKYTKLAKLRKEKDADHH